MKTLIIDNYDSFTYNLYQFVGELGGNPQVVYNDAITIREIRKFRPSHVIISPGPGSPEISHDVGISPQILDEFASATPILGVCLGHQLIAHHYGGKILRYSKPVHGKTSSIFHDSSLLFSGVPNPLQATRYHSLLADPASFPSCLKITAKTSDGKVMALQHERFPLFGVQFHPESIGTPAGKKLLKNFLFLRANRK